MSTDNKDIVVKKYILRGIKHALIECAVLTEELENIDKYDWCLERQHNFSLHIRCQGLIKRIGELTKEVKCDG